MRPFKRWAQEQRVLERPARRAPGRRGARWPTSPASTSRRAALFVTAHEVAPVWHVRMQAAFQDFIDGAIAKTINLPSAATAQPTWRRSTAWRTSCGARA